MLVKNYIKAKDLDEAYNILNKNRSNRLIGGGIFLKQSDSNINTLIDLYDLELNYIEDYVDRVEIGAMTSFTDLERSEILRDNFGPIFEDSVKDIVGLQFKNSVTVGASVYSKYGFSDLITGLLVLNTRVLLHKYGEIGLEDFLNRDDIKKDILTKLIIYKDNRKSSFKSFRNNDMGFSVLNLAISKYEDKLRLAVGARPARAILVEGNIDEANSLDMIIDDMLKNIEFGSNYISSREYRERLARVLGKRALEEVL